MPSSVAQYAEIVDWSTSPASKTITGLAWSLGDTIVVLGISADGNTTIGLPTNGNLTFAEQAGSTGGSGAECQAYAWTAEAGSAQTGQTITIPRSAGADTPYGAVAYVVTGSDGFAEATQNRTESTISLAVAAGSSVFYIMSDWNEVAAGQTGVTGSGTLTERLDGNVAAQYTYWSGQWVDTSATTVGFGITSYSGMKVTHAIVEVLGSAGGDVGSTLRRKSTRGLYLRSSGRHLSRSS